MWIIHRSSATLHNNEKGAELNPPIAECCKGAPPVLRFDPAGNLVGHWGGPGEGYEWPMSNHGIAVDHKGNVWIGGNGKADSHILKFTRDGKFLQQFGGMGKNAGSNSPDQFGRVAKIWIDPKANEAYIADGSMRKTRWVQARCGTSRFPKTRNSVTSTSPMVKTSACASSCAKRWTS